MEGLDQANGLRSLPLAIDQASPDKVALGQHCCEGGLIFMAGALSAADDGEASGGKAEGKGFEPLSTDSESAVLPLDESPILRRFVFYHH